MKVGKYKDLVKLFSFTRTQFGTVDEPSLLPSLYGMKIGKWDFHVGRSASALKAAVTKLSVVQNCSCGGNVLMSFQI